MMAATRSIGVVGAGTMGRGIAELAARSGFVVNLHDAVEGAAERAISVIRENLARDVEKGRLESGQAAAIVMRISAGGLEEAAQADVVVEAIREDLEAKRALFRDLSRLALVGAILTTNTSSLGVTTIGEAVRDPSLFAGFHFFNPPTRMRVVEIVRGKATSEATLTALRGVADALGQRAFVVGDTPGFLVNHIGRALTGEALRLLDEGIASAAEIDRIVRDAFHFRMGPFELLDLVGLDVSAEVTEQVWRGFDEEPRFRPAPIAQRRVSEGRLGRKSGRGFYTYDPMGRTLPEPDPIVGATPAPVRLVVEENWRAGIESLFPAGLITDDRDAIAIVAPIGSDVATEARRHHLDAGRTIGFDPLFTDRVTLAGPAEPASAVAAAIRTTGRPVSIVTDGPGMPAQRIAAMMVLIAAEAAARGIGTPEDIDAAARLALAYPVGPLELGDAVGAKTVADIAAGLFALTGDRRWRPSSWLDRHARSGERLAQSQSQQ